MSHFTVTVVGEDVEAALQPFHEFECTGIDDQYVLDVDNTAEVQEQIDRSEGEDKLTDALSWFGLEDRQVPAESLVDRSDKHKYGFAVVADGKLVKSVKRTNPNKHWDWWVVGGRWRDYFLLKDGTRADRCLKGQIDVEAMQNERRDAALVEWSNVYTIIDGRTWLTWESVREANAADIEAARTAYNAQAAVQLLRRHEDFRWGDLDRFLVSRDEFSQTAALAAVPTFALVNNGMWLERGSMGWFGVVHGESSPQDWCRRYMGVFSSLPDDAILTNVDCHI